MNKVDRNVRCFSLFENYYTLKAQANGCNIGGQQHAAFIVGPNMLRPLAWNHNCVGTCYSGREAPSLGFGSGSSCSRRT